MIALALLAGLALLFLATVIGAAVAAHRPGPCLDCRDGVHAACDGCCCPVDHAESTVNL